MIPKITFTQVVSPEEVKNTDQVSTSSSIQDKSKTDSRELVRARIEFLLDRDVGESYPTSFMDLQNN